MLVFPTHHEVLVFLSQKKCKKPCDLTAQNLFKAVILLFSGVMVLKGYLCILPFCCLKLLQINNWCFVGKKRCMFVDLNTLNHVHKCIRGAHANPCSTFQQHFALIYTNNNLFSSTIYSIVIKNKIVGGVNGAEASNSP